MLKNFSCLDLKITISRDQSTFFQQGEKELYKGIMKFISVSKLVLKY